MPTGAAGTTITLDAQYQDGVGQAVTPINPLVSIYNPSGGQVEGDATPTPGGREGLYTFDFAIPGAGPLGSWTATWSGLVSGVPVEVSETFSVVAAGSISFEDEDCTYPLWKSIDAFLADHPEVDRDDAESVVAEATWILNGLTYDRYHGVECRRDVYSVVPYVKVIDLARTPVDTVFSMAVLHECSASETVLEGWCLLAGNRLQISSTPQQVFGFSGCGCSGLRRIEVLYRTKSNLPPGTARIVDRLAVELWKASTGRACSLPERVQNVSREGVTWTTIDPMDFLENGLTGIGSIDQWLARANGKGPAKLVDPLTRPPLIESDLIGCSEGCVPL